MSLTQYRRSAVLQEVLAERVRQDTRFGEQNHEANNWCVILAEEFGEVAKEACDVTFSGKSTEDLEAELVQVAAVCVAWLECIRRGRE